MKAHKLLLLGLICFSISVSSFAQGEPDRDGDGVPDSVDRCISEVGPASNNGCPLPAVQTTEEPRPVDVPPPDSDGDGTADPLDRCPNEAGDGANGGCPAGSTGTNPTNPQSNPVNLLAAPTSGECVVSTQGTNRVIIRQYPNVESAIMGVIDPNEWVEVLGYFDYENLASLEGIDFNLFPFDPNSPDPNYQSWFLVQDSSSPATGWVAATLLRTGGDCVDFMLKEAQPETAYMTYKLTDLIVTSYQTGGSTSGDANSDGTADASDFTVWRSNFVPIFPHVLPFIALPSEPLAAAYIKFDGVDGESKPNPDSPHNTLRSDLMPEGCELAMAGDGSVMPQCEDGSQPAFIPICSYQQLEAGVYTEICYEVEVPEGCVLTTVEAGVWQILCEEDADSIQVTPIGETEPILDIKFGDGSVQIGLLLPAVQKVREAAR